jgi:hypothetical protein
LIGSYKMNKLRGEGVSWNILKVRFGMFPINVSLLSFFCFLSFTSLLLFFFFSLDPLLNG